MNISPIIIFGLISLLFTISFYLFVKYSSEIKLETKKSNQKLIPKVNIESGFSALSISLFALCGIFISPWMISFSQSMEKSSLMISFSIIILIFIIIGIFIGKVGIKEWEDSNE